MKKRSAAICAILALMLCVSGCGGSSGSKPSASYDAGAEEGDYANYAAEESAEGEDYYSKEASADGEVPEGDANGGDGGSESALRAQDGQKIVYTASLSMQTLE